MSHEELSKSFIRLLKIMTKLRSPQGCPWDAQQTPETLKPFLLEECYEVLEAIDQGSPQAICQELGDLLLQIVFLSRIFEERKLFDIGDVSDGIADKLVRRHPHVFEGVKIGNMDALNRQWDEIKTREQGAQTEKSGLLENIPKALPALSRAQKISDRASRVGFDWPDQQGAVEKIHEEFEELKNALSKNNAKEIEHEFGDILFSLVNLARFLDIDSENALQKAVNRFKTRFEFLERKLSEDGKDLSKVPLEVMDKLWETAKNQERLADCGKDKKD
jgi:MazG family protein